MLKAVKFGGSSVAGAAQFQKVREIVLSDPARRVVVASAAGKRFSGDHKLTDLLYLCHAHLTYGVSCEEILSEIEGRFVEIRDTLGLTMDVEGEFAALRARLDRSFPVDALVSRGEAFTSRLLAEYLGYTYVDAADCIFFSPDGRIDRQKTDEAIRRAAEAYGTIVIPGFYGSLPSGKLKVMSRGGSDITGALAAAALGAEVYENWTDVSGILMADPKIVKDPSPIRRITYNELRELAFLGASVLHEEAVLPVKERGIPLNIRNTNAPDDPGTMILQTVPEEERDQDRFITGVAGHPHPAQAGAEHRRRFAAGVGRFGAVPHPAGAHQPGAGFLRAGGLLRGAGRGALRRGGRAAAGLRRRGCAGAGGHRPHRRRGAQNALPSGRFGQAVPGAGRSGHQYPHHRPGGG